MSVMAIGTLLAAFVAAAALARWVAVWRWQAARGFMEREAAAVDERLSDAFSDSLTGRGFVWLRYGGAVGAAVVTLALSDGSLVLALAVGAACYLAPGAILGLVQRRRRKRLEVQIPDLIATLSATIKAGFSLQRSFEDMAARMRPPICEELGLVVQRIHAGQTLEAALTACDRRLGIPSLHLVLQAIIVTESKGGRLTEVLGKVAVALREIGRVEERLRTETAGIKLATRIMAGMPLVVGGLLYLVAPDQIMVLFRTLAGNAILLGAALLDYAGFAAIRRIGNLRV